MGYHDAREIPNYWAYARNFVLQDHMFEPNASWSLPAHLFMVSGWSAKCSTQGRPDELRQRARPRRPPPDFGGQPRRGPDYAWTDLTYLLHKHGVSWRYYVVKGTEPDCEDDAAIVCKAIPQDAKTPGIWNPLPWFDTVRENGSSATSRPCATSSRPRAEGRCPRSRGSCRTARSASTRRRSCRTGQAYVTTLVNAIMRSPNWSSTAIFLAWDDWGGFYDHVVPPRVDAERLRAAGAGHRHQPVREARATSTTRR